MCEKSFLRKTYRELRVRLKSAERDKRISELALQTLADRGERFFVYLSLPEEAGTEAIVRGLTGLGKTVCAPRIAGGEMFSVPLTDKRERTAFGVFQPSEGEETTCDVAFCPLIAADREGYRLGFGGGYYDRYLAAHPEIFRVGLAYEGQVADKLPRDPHDCRLDALVTECGVRFFPPRNA